MYLSSSSQKKTSHATSLSDTPGADGRQDVLHGVIDGQTRGDAAPGAVDVHVDGLLGGLRLEEEKLGHDDTADIVIDGAHEADDPVLEQT